MANWKFCNCCGTENECLIHSSVSSKGKAWPASVLESGTAPTETENTYEFTAPGKIRLDHDDILYWDGDEFTSGSDPVGYNYGDKRVRLIVSLLDDDSCFELTMMDDGAGHHKKVRFVAHTPPIAKYPIVSVVWYYNTTGTDSNTEDLVDRWLEDYRVSYRHAEPATDAGYMVCAYSLPDANYVASETQEYGHAVGPGPSEVLADNGSIWLECISGTVRVTQLELYHTCYGSIPSDPLTQDGPTCGATATFSYMQLCSGESLDGSGSSGIIDSQIMMANTLPQCVELTLPTLEVNPDAGISATECEDCTIGGGSTVLLYVDDGDLDFLNEEPYCDYVSSEITLGCDEFTMYFFPWYDGINNPAATTAGSVFLTEWEVLGGIGHPLLSSLAYIDYDNIRNWNAAVTFDHIGVSGVLLWTNLAYSDRWCEMPGDVCDIHLPDVGIWTIL